MAKNWKQDVRLNNFFEDNDLKDYEIFRGASCPKDPKVDFVAKYDKSLLSLRDMQYFLALKNMESFIDAACAKVLDIPYEEMIRKIMAETTNELVKRYKISIGEYEK